VGGAGRDFYVERFRKFEHLFVVSGLNHLKKIPELNTKVTDIPAVYFDGYHPDSVYLSLEGKLFDGPIGISNSCIVFSAFQNQCSTKETEALFNGEFYQMAGYFEQ